MADALHHYIEEFALLYEGAGLPRIAGRILGWLMICDPSEQTASQLAEALGASKGSVSTMTRLLTRLELVERVPQRGSRQDLYRIRPGAWTELMKARLSGLAVFTQLAEKGLRVMGSASPARRQRLEEMHELYSFFEEEMAELIRRLEDRRPDRTRSSEHREG